VLDVVDDADDRTPGAVGRDPEPLADRRGTGPEAFRELAVDDQDRRRVVAIARIEAAPRTAPQGDLNVPGMSQGPEGR
jgi:hypothetical protein